jgi:hypothetical protein
VPKASYTVSILVDVLDKRVLLQSALSRAKDDGLTSHEARSLLKPGGQIDVGACLVMLFDPGNSPQGCEIMESRCE